jgi:four helix bundle protein
MQKFRDLNVWRKAMDLVEECYSATTFLPDAERFGLVSQMRRSSISIPSNIAEGCGRRTNRDFARFLHIAYGSACELETQALAAVRVTAVDPATMAVIVEGSEEVRRMLTGLLQALERPIPTDGD